MAKKAKTEVSRLAKALELADRKVECVGKLLDTHYEAKPDPDSKDRARWEKAGVEFENRLKAYQDDVARVQALLDKALLEEAVL